MNFRSSSDFIQGDLISSPSDLSTTTKLKNSAEKVQGVWYEVNKISCIPASVENLTNCSNVCDMVSPRSVGQGRI